MTQPSPENLTGVPQTAPRTRHHRAHAAGMRGLAGFRPLLASVPPLRDATPRVVRVRTSGARP